MFTHCPDSLKVKEQEFLSSVVRIGCWALHLSVWPSHSWDRFSLSDRLSASAHW